jgi:transglutaminase-like putative cysteine protease
MTYWITHKTQYEYKGLVSVGNHALFLTPRTMPNQRCMSNSIRIWPKPATRSERLDYFGNPMSFFTIQEPHERLEVEALSEVLLDIASETRWPDRSITWEHVARSAETPLDRETLTAYQFVFESPRVRRRPEFAAYASQSFSPGRPLTEALLDLTARIHSDFRFDSKATNVRTPVEEFFRKRRGVCQDFAHFQIACLRSLNLPARYVSGYLRTQPPPGRPRLSGADASHAWVSVYCLDAGWLDVDPTNNVVPSLSHVTLAWGRDYGDVSPMRGIILGGRDHTLKVAVDVEAVDDSGRRSP